MSSFSVRVVNDEQRPISGARVVLIFTDPLRGKTGEEYTDSDGFAYFDNYDEGEVEVFIRGVSYGKSYYKYCESVTITI